MLGGDGGDEIFGGNERYAKDYFFQRYFGLPKPVKSVGSMIKTVLGPVDQRFANKIKNFINRGALANPERFYTDDSFASDFYEELLTPDFRASCARGSSLSILEHFFADADATSELNRLMYIDLQMAIADNDLTKVTRTAKTAGVSVLFPYLTPDLIELMGRVPVGLKVNRTVKRYLFKKAVAPIIPPPSSQRRSKASGCRSDTGFATIRQSAVFLETFSWRGAALSGLYQQALSRTYPRPSPKRRLGLQQ